MPLFSRRRLDQVASALERLAASPAGDDVAASCRAELRQQEATFRYEWTPTLHPWPATASPLIDCPRRTRWSSPSGARAGTGRGVGAGDGRAARASQLHLFGQGPARCSIPFEQLSFIAGIDGKAEVDVVLDDITSSAS